MAGLPERLRVTADKPRVLVLSRSYPNNVMELLGLWVQAQVRHLARTHEIKVVSPVPYCPPLPGLPENYARFRRVLKSRLDGTIEVFHPRMLVGPGYSTHSIEWRLYLASVSPLVKRIQQRFPVDLIHAHFTYPDGAVAVELGRRYGVPVVITEQNPWGSWLNKYPSVRQKSIWTAEHSTRHIAISQAVRRTIEEFAGTLNHLVVIPDGVNQDEFTLGPPGQERDPNQILFVGAIRPVKGVDVLIQAMQRLIARRPEIRLVLIGEAFFGPYRQEELRLKRMAVELGLGDRIQFSGKQPLDELVRQMQRSAALVLSSRAESLGMVLVEALACGTPVVATRCGGPEDIVNEQVGVLVEPEDPEALATGIERVLDNGGRYHPQSLRSFVLERFGLESVGARLASVYQEALRARLVPS